MSVRFVVPGPPQPWQRPRFNRATGSVFTAPGPRSYSETIKVYALEAMRAACIQAMIEGPIYVAMTAYFPVPASFSRKKTADALAGRIAPPRGDLDQFVKILLDAMNRVVFADDRQVTTLRARKQYSGSGGYLSVEVMSDLVFEDAPG